MGRDVKAGPVGIHERRYYERREKTFMYRKITVLLKRKAINRTKNVKN
jgi:hypothetical protein